MSDIAGVIENLYAAVNDRDERAIAACYHSQARFRDSLFDVRGTEIVAMWRMLAERSGDLQIDVDDIRVVGDERALAHWTARYSFGSTARPVVNEAKAAYRFAEDGRIVEHVDAFDLEAWAAQALGWKGALLVRMGGSGLLRRKLRRQLDEFAS